MAVYAATTNLGSGPVIKKMGNSIGLIFGTITLSNYNSTRVEITSITSKFKTVYTVLTGVAAGGHLTYWDPATKSVKAYVPNTGAEVANDVNVGLIPFVAIGAI